MRMASSDSARSEKKPGVSWTDTCVDQLIGGESLNIVGLDGSGRSQSLHLIAAALDPSDWATRIWSPADLATMQRREIVSGIDSLFDTSRIPVLLFDDFGEFLLTPDGHWLERFLFSRVFEEISDEWHPLRSVVVTHPRDREIVGAGSGLRERARRIHPPERISARQEMARFGCASGHELLLLTGLNNHLLSVGGDTPESRRGIARSTAQEWLPSWIGQLDYGHQNRLGDVLNRPQPPRWRPDDVDPSLSPIVVPNRSENPVRCAITESIEVEDLGQLLVGQPWPDRDLRAAVRRFCARCGNDPNPLWVDNYLSDTSKLDFSRLVEFLQRILTALPGLESIRLLSRNWVGNRRVYARDILTALLNAGISPELENRLHWRLYDQKNHANLHRRELILSSRHTSFSLPPACIAIGQDPSSNETDAPVAIANCGPAYAAWNNSIKVTGGGRTQV